MEVLPVVVALVVPPFVFARLDTNNTFDRLGLARALVVPVDSAHCGTYDTDSFDSSSLYSL